VRCGHHTAVLSKTGALFFWGTGVFGTFWEPTLVIDQGVIEASVGGCFGAYLDCEGYVWTWGSNSSGELGLGDYEVRAHPFPVKHLKGKKIRSLACGGAFAVALGEDKNEGQEASPTKQLFN